jgi:outer membrane protein TolC
MLFQVAQARTRSADAKIKRSKADFLPFVNPGN